MMDLERFQDLLDVRGSDLSRWPEQDRAQAEALLGELQAARAALATARRLDEALTRTMTARHASGTLRARILSGTRERSPAGAPAGSIRGALFGPWRLGAALSTAALVGGLYVGAFGPPLRADSDPASVEMVYVDVAELAFGAAAEGEILP